MKQGQLFNAYDKGCGYYLRGGVKKSKCCKGKPHLGNPLTMGKLTQWKRRGDVFAATDRYGLELVIDTQVWDVRVL